MKAKAKKILKRWFFYREDKEPSPEAIGIQASVHCTCDCGFCKWKERHPIQEKRLEEKYDPSQWDIE
jgi:hypothetical protein